MRALVVSLVAFSIACATAPTERAGSGIEFNQMAYLCTDKTRMVFTESSKATLTLGPDGGEDSSAEKITFPVEGRVSLCDLPCGSDDCIVRLNSFRVVGPEDGKTFDGDRGVERFRVSTATSHAGLTFFGEAEEFGDAHDWDVEITIPEGAVKVLVLVRGSVDGESIRFYETLEETTLRLDYEEMSGEMDVQVGGVQGEVNASLDARITNRPPVADAGGDREVPCDDETMKVKLDGSGSYDPDGDELTMWWRTESNLGEESLVYGETASFEFPLGRHEVTLAVGDGTATATDTILVSCEGDEERTDGRSESDG